MSNWAQGVAEMDSALMAEFSIPVIIHFSTGDRPVQGIFDNPASLSTVSGGGYIADSEPELYLQDKDANGINHRHLVTVAGKQWLVVRPPEPDGTGMTKLTLGHYNGQQSSKPSIRY
ncbi:head-tail joining protein [Vibrio antiquarius]|uniref:head-tail joining protein n=1 Tax=Vibrio antiquarius (strain Ex25) TaxID=150340 RepID=UPI00265B4D68|nr:head-tail joining protein [Vibrio antiquarius]MCR9549012.1 head-tail joining protein [Vibrio antiquarius]